MSEERETPAGTPAPDSGQDANEAVSEAAASVAAPEAADTAEQAASDASSTAQSVDSADGQPGRRAHLDAGTAGSGAPIEESAATTTELLAAVDRAGELGGETAATTALPEAEAATAATPTTAIPEERPAIVLPDEMPSAGPSAQTAAAPPAAAPSDKIMISADHPMAALYMQTPMPPDIKGNRGAGVLIAILATIVFAVVYTGVLALWIAPETPPSTFIDRLISVGLWPVAAASVAFFVGLVLVVLFVGRSGWWAYVLGGFLVGALVWFAAVVGTTYSLYLAQGNTGVSGMLGDNLHPLNWIQQSGLTFTAILAGVAAREVVVWFGAWIGARGRRVTRQNTEAIAEYETALAEAQAKQP